MPTQPSDLLTPFGSTVTVELGLELLDGSISSVAYGKYDISSASTKTEADSRTTDISLIDISDRVERYRFETPYAVAASQTLSLMIRNLVRNRTGFDPGLTTIPILLGSKRVFGLDPATGPWSEVLDVLSGHSLTAWYNRSGQIQAGFINPGTDNTYPLGTQASVVADFDARPANVVVARGESTDGSAPVQAVSMDTDPGSPTYAGATVGGSPYGRRTQFYTSPMILTAAQAQAAADAILAENVGAGATYTMTCAYDPTIDAGDAVSSGGSSYLVDAVTVDLTGETSAKLRKV